MSKIEKKQLKRKTMKNKRINYEYINSKVESSVGFDLLKNFLTQK